MSAAGLYKFDNNDVYTTYGLIAQDGTSDTFLIPQKPKPPQIAKDWPEQNLIEFDLTKRYFAPRTFTFKAVLVASSEADFNAKYNALVAWTELPGVRVIESTELSRQYGCFCTGFTELSRKTRIKNSRNVAVALVMEFTEAPLGVNNTFPYTFPIKF